MEQRLGRRLVANGGLRHAGGLRPELYAAETGQLVGELSACDKLPFRLDLLQHVLLLHLRQPLHALGQCLSGETFFIGPVDDVAHEEHVFHADDRFGGQEAEERHAVLG